MIIALMDVNKRNFLDTIIKVLVPLGKALKVVLFENKRA